MILLCLIFSIEAKIDSLKMLLDKQPEVSTVIQLNKCYLQKGEFSNGINLIKKYEERFESEGKPILIYCLGEDYFFAGKIILARDEYLKVVSRFPDSEIANNALERLYLIEYARKDTSLLKRLANSICLYETEQFDIAKDSLTVLLKTIIGDYAYYYLALLYYTEGKLPLALSALYELNNSFPEHKIRNATLLLVEINLRLNNKKDAQKILEDLIIKEPNSIYAARARRMLKENLE